VPHTAQDVRRIALDPHPAAAPIALLPSPELAVEECLIDGNARR
jgi:hypothetical protein